MNKMISQKATNGFNVADLTGSILQLLGTALYNVSPQFYFDRIVYNPNISRRFSFKSPSTLLMAYPCSGSTRIGNVLNSSPDVAYLHEPVTLSLMKRLGSSLIDQDNDETVLKFIDEYMEMALSGTPPSKVSAIIRDKFDFSPFVRWKRTLLIKEINPNAVEFINDGYALKMILLLRHPAAVMESVSSLWGLEGSCEDFGRHYGDSMARALKVSHRKSSSLGIFTYEDVVASPLEQFSKLYHFMGVRKPGNFSRIIDSFRSDDVENKHDSGFDVPSSLKAEQWKRNLNEDMILELKRGYFNSDLAKLGYYRGSKHWVYS